MPSVRDHIRPPSLTPAEARELHYEALVIDAQQPPATSGFLFNDNMRAALAELHERGVDRGIAGNLMARMAAREVQINPEAVKDYVGLWNTSGVTIGAGTYIAGNRIEVAFEAAVKRIAEARSMIDVLGGEVALILTADDIERVYREGKHGVIIDFQDTIPFGTDIERIDLFYNLGLRQVQLTYNLRNLVGDGCTEHNASGITYFGRTVVERLNELNMIVDVSHCSEAVGWDAIELSTSPVIVSHSNAKAVTYHDRAKSDDLARAIADQDGFFGVTIVPGFVQDESTAATLDHFVDHVVHLVNVMGIDHVGIGNDKCGPGGQTGSLVEYPDDMPDRPHGAFDWSGFRREHRVHDDYHNVDYQTFADWPLLTMSLAMRGFNEDELRKLLGLNYLRVFRQIVG